MKNLFLAKKNKRMNIIDLKKNHPEEFGRFVMALKNLEESDDWYRICVGKHRGYIKIIKRTSLNENKNEYTMDMSIN